MTRKDWYEIGAIVAGGAILWWLVSRGNLGAPAATPGADTTAPNYLRFNQNDNTATPLASTPGLVSDQLGNGDGGPACASCSATPVIFGGADAFEQVLTNKLGAIVDTYTRDILEQIPGYVSQFFNDQSGVDESNAAATTFSNFGQLTGTGLPNFGGRGGLSVYTVGENGLGG